MSKYDELFADQPQAASAPEQPAQSKYDALFEDMRPASAALAVQGARATSPDAAAEANALARRYKLPPAVAEQLAEDYKARAATEDARAAFDKAPRLGSWVAEQPDRAKVLHDDLPTLSGIEQTVRTLKSVPSAIVSGFPRMASGFYGFTAAPFEAAGQVFGGAEDWLASLMGAQGYKSSNAGQIVGGTLRGIAQDQERFTKQIYTPAADAGIIERGVGSGLQSAVQSVVSAPFALRQSGEQAALALMGATTFGSSYLKATDKGKTPLEAIPFASADAVAEVVTEKYFGFSGLMAQVRAGSSAAKMFVYEIVKETPGEIGATIWQNFNEWTSLNPDKSVSEWVAEQPEAIGETIVATLVGGGAQIGAIKGTQKVLGRMSGEEGRAQQAEQHAAAIEQLGKLGAASKLNARDATTFKALVAQISDEEGDAPTQFFIDPATLVNSLNQSGVTMAELEAMAPTVAAQLQAPTGGDIRVPVSEFLLAGEELTVPLIDHLRTSEDAMTRAEAQEYIKTQGDSIRADVEAELQKSDDQAQFRQSIDGVRTQFETELNTAKRFTPAVNKAYSELLANFYGATASRLGMTPQQLLQKYKLRVQAQGVAGERTLNQGSLESVREAWSAKGIKHAINEKDGTIEVDQIVVPEGQREQGAGTAAMQQLLDYADATGQRVVLTPSSDFGGTKSRLEKFYKGLGFKPNKGRSKDFTTRATMIREPKQAGTLNQSALPAAEFTTDENGNPEINSPSVRLMFAQPTERFEFIPDPGQQMYNLAIMSPEGEYLGYTELVFENGKVTGLYDIEVNEDTRSRGTGAKAIEAILAANPNASILISNVVPAARGFWEKVGVPQQNVGEGDAYDGTLDWNTYAASETGRKSLKAGGNQGAGGSDSRGAEGGGTGPVSGVLDQGQDGVTPRAQIAFPADIAGSPSVISLLAGADLSSFIHESGHFFLEVQSDLATRIQQQIDSGASVSELERGVVADMNRLLEWFGVKGNENQTPLTEWAGMTLDQKREHHETFARGFERYAMEGNAPSIGLQDVFNRFRSWLVQVYKTLRGLNVELNDDVRQVMGRMLATDFAIEEAEAQRSMGPLFKDAEKAGMTLEEFSAYQAAAQGATDKAAAELQTRGMKDMKWLSRAKDKALKARQQEVDELRREIKNEVRSEVMAEPVYQVWQFLTGKQQEVIPGAQAVDEIDAVQQSGKLRTQVLREMYGTEETAIWRELSARRMTSDEKGMHPEIVAEMFGYDSADAMVKALVDAMPPSEVIDARTDQRMLEMFGDITSEEALQRAADEAVHNEARARFIATEMKALEAANKVNERQGKSSVNVLARAAKDYAQQIITRLKVREIRPNQYATAEARSARLAEKAFMAGKTEEAATHKRNQLVNNYATKAAYDAQEEVKSAQKYFRKFDKRSKSIDAGYQDQIEQMLERFDFRQASLKEIDRRKSFAAWVEEQRADGIEPSVPAELLDEANRKSFKDMTLEELRGLRETVEQIEHLGRLKNRLLLARDKRDFDEIAADIAASVIKYGGKKRPLQLEGPNPAADLFDGFAAQHRKMASLIRQMDGNQDNGPMYEHLGRAMNERGTMEDVMVEKATVALRDIYAPIMKLKGGITGYRSKLFIPEINASLTRGGRLSVALNWGNEANRQRLMDGDKWSEGQVRAIMKTLTPAELEFVNKTWEYLDTFWPEVAAKEKRLTGVEPEKVEAVPFNVIASDGTEVAMRGGYYPLSYDSSRSDRSRKQEQAAVYEDMKRGAVGRATTRRGHTKERLKEVDRAVRKDLNVITQHVTQVVHDLAWHEWVNDANKILADKEISNSIQDYYGPNVLDTMHSAIEGIATADVVSQTKLDAIMLHIRSNVTRATMGASLTTAFLQPFGLTQSMVRIGPEHVLRGMARWAGDAAQMESTVGWIKEKSDFMRLRSKTLNKELREIRGSVGGKSKTMQVVDAGLFVMMQKMQMVADVPTWVGQYQKSIAEGLDEDAAIAMADRAVLESQGGGQTKDLSELQRKHPLLTQFYSYFSVTLNLAAEQTAATNFKNPAAVAGWLGDMALLMVIPAILPSLIMFGLKGGDDDEEGMAKRIAEWQLGYLLGTAVGLREFSGGVGGFDYAGPPVGRIVGSGIKFGKQALQGEIDEPLVLAAIDLMGTAFGIPTIQATRSYKGWKAWDEGEEGAGPQSVLFGPPPKK